VPTLTKAKAAIAQVLGEELKIPAAVEARIKRGSEAMAQGASKNNECLRFARGRQYSWVDSQNVIREQDTTSRYEGRGGKARHRVRTVRNYIFDHVETEVASATQKVPGYDIAPTSSEPRRISAARLARKVMYYGYEQWGIARATERVIRYAVICKEGFAWPYFDNTVGPFMQAPVLDPETGEEIGETKTVGMGEIKIRVFGPNEVFWEPGLNFEDSLWHGIKQARDLDEVMAMEGYVGGKLTPDAQQAATSRESSSQDRLVMVTEYLERPSRARPEGRWITMANGKVIVPERPYPCRDGKGKVLDEPVLHEMHYTEDPDSDRNLGLVQFLIDPQRQLNHAVSKIAEWVNLTLNPQLLIVNGKVLSGKNNDVPGAVVRVAGVGTVEWKKVPTIPPELFRQKEEAINDMSRIAAQNDIPSQVESGTGIRYLIEKDTSRRSGFYANLARFHSRLARHCLYLCQRHYTEPRLLKIRGEQGMELVPDFLGAELLGEVDVRVQPGSLEPLTRESIEAKILAYADRGWISAHEAMAAINAGTAEGLVQSYERDIARANLIIQKVKEGPEVLFNTPPRRPFFGEEPGVDEETGEEREYIPGWMPRPFDNVPVQKDVIADWMKSSEYDDLPPPFQEALNAVYDSYLQLEAKTQAQAAAAQEETAQSLGMSNASKPQTPPPLPNQAPLNQG
jgi:hypothetical protein